jgi:GPH family glycoside/pentoside/hexuronide:cation symporter
MMPYFNKYILQPENPNLWLAIYLATYFGAGLICLPIWIWAAKRFEKKPVWLVSFAPGVIGGFSLFLWGEGDMIPALISLTFAGAGFGAGLFLGPSMQADVIDYDELCTGKRREAQYSALWSIMTKFMVIPSMSIPLAVLASVGYAPNIVQSDEVQLTIRLIFCLAPATAGCIAFFAACFYPITKAVHGEIWAGINAHKRGETVTDPISGHLLLPPARRGVGEDTGWFLDHFSMGELSRSRGGNTVKVQLEILLYCIGSTVFFAGFVWLLFDEVELDVAPGLMAVLYVVGVGISLTASVYHIIRLRVASQLQDYSDAEVALHVKVSHQMKYGLAE